MCGLKISVTAAIVIWASVCLGAEIVVFVEDEKHRPVKNAVLWIVPCDQYGAFLEQPKTLLTDTKGQAKVGTDLLASSLWEVTHIVLWAEKGKFQSLHKTWSKQVSGMRNRTSFLRLTLKPTVEVVFNVKIVNAKGSPVEGAYVFLWRVLGAGGLSPLLRIWTTDKLGRVRSSIRLPIPFIRTAQLYDLPLKFTVIAYHPAEGWAGSIVDIKGLADLNFSLSPHQRTNIRLQDCFGEPLSGLNGRLAAIQMPNMPSLIPLPTTLFAFKTDLAGEVALPIPQNGKGLLKWSREAPWGLKREAESVWLDAGTSRTIRFHRKTIYVTGRVIDAWTGKPLEDEGVILSVIVPTSNAPSLPFCSKTNKSGQFFIETEPFLYAPTGMLLGLPDGRRMLLWGSTEVPFFKPPFPPFRCQRWVISDVALDPPDAKISGMVVDGQGKPVPFAFVSGMNTELQQFKKPLLVRVSGKSCDGSLWEFSKQINGEKVSPYAYTFADQQGRFQMKLRAGTWKFLALWVGPPHRPPQRIPNNATFLWPNGIGPINPKKGAGEVVLKISKGAKIKVILTVNRWANFWWHAPEW